MAIQAARLVGQGLRGKGTTKKWAQYLDWHWYLKYLVITKLNKTRGREDKQKVVAEGLSK